jgi:hypothetical protein
MLNADIRRHLGFPCNGCRWNAAKKSTRASGYFFVFQPWSPPLCPRAIGSLRSGGTHGCQGTSEFRYLPESAHAFESQRKMKQSIVGTVCQNRERRKRERYGAYHIDNLTLGFLPMSHRQEHRLKIRTRCLLLRCSPSLCNEQLTPLRAFIISQHRRFG